MDENIMSINEGQLKKIGMSEAFTPELQALMKEGNPMIAYSFKKQYDDDKVGIDLQLKKSASSDCYYPKRFDLHLQKDGQDNPVSQAFYIYMVRAKTNEAEVRLENKYTLKEAYNLLAGRPVYKTFYNKEGEEYQSWNQINFKKLLDNGNHEIKHYNNNYGFKLEDVLAKYSIKDLLTENYKQNLMESLQRGNMQKVTFNLGDGKEEKLYISPSITTGSLNIYNEQKQRIPLDDQLKNGLIDKSFGEELQQRFGNKQMQTEAKPEITGKAISLEGALKPEAEKKTVKKSQKAKQTSDKEKPVKKAKQKIS